MAEKEPEFVVTDRRKFNPDGERRLDAPEEKEWASTPIFPKKEEPKPSGPQRVSSTPAPAAPPAAATQPGVQTASADANTGASAEDGDLPQPPTEAESAEAHAVYKESARQLDEMVSVANPGMQPVAPMDFPRLVQSLYMSALMQMGAGTPEGQQPRLDILGARQTIDMLGVLTEKTAGNLTPEETSFLQSALFELRMGFLEITQAIARNAMAQAQEQAKKAQTGAQPKGGPEKTPGKPSLVR